PFEIESFKKTNGQDMEVLGTKVYVLYYSTIVVFPNGYRPECVQGDGQFAGFNCALQTGPGNTRPISRNTRRVYDGTIQFQKSENGWLPTVSEPNYRVASDADGNVSGGSANGSDAIGAARATAGGTDAALKEPAQWT